MPTSAKRTQLTFRGTLTRNSYSITNPAVNSPRSVDHFDFYILVLEFSFNAQLSKEDYQASKKDATTSGECITRTLPRAGASLSSIIELKYMNWHYSCSQREWTI